jgi:hypothetical protein
VNGIHIRLSALAAKKPKIQKGGSVSRSTVEIEKDRGVLGAVRSRSDGRDFTRDVARCVARE